MQFRINSNKWIRYTVCPRCERTWNRGHKMMYVGSDYQLHQDVIVTLLCSSCGGREFLSLNLTFRQLIEPTYVFDMDGNFMERHNSLRDFGVYYGIGFHQSIAVEEAVTKALGKPGEFGAGIKK